MGNNLRIIIAIALAGFFGYILFNSFVAGEKDVIIKDDGSQLVRINGYNHPDPEKVFCAAVEPECGWCPGEVIDESCYADPETADKYNNR